MAATVPVAIGTRGTIGSLVRKEIEYFTKHESDRSGSARRTQTQGQMLDTGSSCSSSSSSTSSKRSSSFWSVAMSWPRRKKRRSSSGGLVLSFRSTSEVNNKDHQLDRIPGFSYRILKSNFKNLHL